MLRNDLPTVIKLTHQNITKKRGGGGESKASKKKKE